MQISPLTPLIQSAVEPGAMNTNDFPAPAGSSDFQAIMSQMTDASGSDAADDVAAPKTQWLLKTLPLPMLAAGLQPDGSFEKKVKPESSLDAFAAPAPDPGVDQAQMVAGSSSSGSEGSEDRTVLTVLQSMLAEEMGQVGSNAVEEPEGAESGSQGLPALCVAEPLLRRSEATEPGLAGNQGAAAEGATGVEGSGAGRADLAREIQSQQTPPVNGGSKDLPDISGARPPATLPFESSQAQPPQAAPEAPGSSSGSAPGPEAAAVNALRFSAPLFSTSSDGQNVARLDNTTVSLESGTSLEGLVGQLAGEPPAAQPASAPLPEDTPAVRVVMPKADLKGASYTPDSVFDPAGTIQDSPLSMQVPASGQNADGIDPSQVPFGPKWPVSEPASEPAAPVLSEARTPKAAAAAEETREDSTVLEATFQNQPVFENAASPAATDTRQLHSAASEAAPLHLPSREDMSPVHNGQPSEAAPDVPENRTTIPGPVVSGDATPSDGRAPRPATPGGQVDAPFEIIQAEGQPAPLNEPQETIPVEQTVRKGMDTQGSRVSQSSAPFHGEVPAATDLQVPGGMPAELNDPAKGTRAGDEGSGAAAPANRLAGTEPLPSSELTGVGSAKTSSGHVPDVKETSKPDECPETAEGRKSIVQESKSGRPEDLAVDPTRPSKSNVAGNQETVRNAIPGITVSADFKSAILARTAPSSSSRPIEFIHQLADRIQSQIQSGQGEVRIQLKPEHLGNLEIKAESGTDGIVARIAADSSSVKQFLESSIHVLQQSLQEQGLKVERIDVVLQPGLDARHTGSQQQHSGQTANGQSAFDAGDGGSGSRPASSMLQAEIAVDPSTAMVLGPHSTFHTVA